MVGCGWQIHSWFYACESTKFSAVAEYVKTEEDRVQQWRRRFGVNGFGWLSSSVK